MSAHCTMTPAHLASAARVFARLQPPFALSQCTAHQVRRGEPEASETARTAPAISLLVSHQHIRLWFSQLGDFKRLPPMIHSAD